MPQPIETCGRLMSVLASMGVVALTSVSLTPTHAAAYGLMVQPMASDGSSRASSPALSGETVVVMLREGTRTVLTFQSDYRGPTQGFALIVPVPVVPNPSDVHTLHSSVVDMVERAAEPQLVELWEQSPCLAMRDPGAEEAAVLSSATSTQGFAAGAPRPEPPSVRVESEFQVGEYDVVVLGASDSHELETWLREQRYAVPEGAAEALRPYIEEGMNFLVAKVDVARLAALSPAHDASLREGHVMLSPLRVHYDSERFVLPARVGLPNSPGEQDLIIHILSPEGRYTAANYRTRFVPTNQRASEGTATDFEATYEQLFTRLSRAAHRTVLTEYAGPITPQASEASCLGCTRSGVPTTVLNALGAAELPGHLPWASEPGQARYAQFVMTRMRYRHAPSGLPEDLVFERADAVEGGFEDAATARAMPRPRAATHNAFGVRFIRKHRFSGAQRCRAPRPNQWASAPG